MTPALSLFSCTVFSSRHFRIKHFATGNSSVHIIMSDLLNLTSIILLVTSLQLEFIIYLRSHFANFLITLSDHIFFAPVQILCFYIELYLAFHSLFYSFLYFFEQVLLQNLQVIVHADPKSLSAILAANL